MRWFLYLGLILPVHAWSAFEPVGFEGTIHGVKGIHISPASIYGGYGVCADYNIPFGMSQLGMQRMGIRLPSGIGAFGLRISNFGSATYRENEISFGYANSYRDVRFGLFNKILYISTKDYGSTYALSWDIGIITSLEIGDIYLVIRDIANPSIGKDRIGSTLVGGMYLSPLDRFDMDIRITKQERFPLSTRVMGIFSIAEFLRLKVGVDTYPASVIGGLSLSVSELGVSYITTFHQVLGLSHIISVSFGEEF